MYVCCLWLLLGVWEESQCHSQLLRCLQMSSSSVVVVCTTTCVVVVCTFVCCLCGCEVFEKSRSVSESESAAEMSSDEFIRVVNCKFNMSCLWPISRLKEKLVKLRTLVYAVCIYAACTLHVTIAITCVVNIKKFNFSRQVKTFLFVQYWRWHPSALETLVPVRTL